MKKFVLVIIMLCMVTGAASAQSVVDVMNQMSDSAAASADMFQATADAIMAIVNGADPQSTPEPENETSGIQPIIYEGSGDDVVAFDDLSVKDYPYLYIEHPSTYGSFRIYNSADKYELYQQQDTHSIIALNCGSLKNISYVEITNFTGDWKLALLPSDTPLVTKYETPVNITGSETSVFHMDAPGKILNVKFTSNGYNSLKQIMPDGTYKLLVNSAGAYSGKVKISNEPSDFEVETSGSWSIAAYGSESSASETVFIDNELLAKNLTDGELSTAADLEIPEEEVEIQTGVLGRWYQCGDAYKFMIYYQPIMAKSQSYQTADGMFILFRVKIANISNEKIPGLSGGSFKLSRFYNDEEISYPLSVVNSTMTSRQWEIYQLDDNINPGMELDTYLVFDVDGKFDDTWYLTFSPMRVGTNYAECKIKMTLPKISYQP